MAMDDIIDGLSEVSCDVLVIGGGTAGPMAALKAKLKNPKANVVCWRRPTSSVRSDSMGMDGLNNGDPGYATPEQYTKEITMPMTHRRPEGGLQIRREMLLDHRGARQLRIRFLKNENGDYASRRCITSAPMCCRCQWRDRQEGAVRQLRRARILISNRYMRRGC